MDIDVQRESIRVSQQNFRAKSLGLEATLTYEEWVDTLNRFNGMCAYCLTNFFVAMDHLIPVMIGGGTTKDNCLPVCKRCNSSKAGRLISNPEAPLEEQINQIRYVLINKISFPGTGNGGGGKPKGEPTTQLNMRLPVETIEKIREYARTRNITQADVIAIAMDRYAKKKQGIPETVSDDDIATVELADLAERIRKLEAIILH
jgi:hypothetical protein